jgi:hypothetical protein
MSMAEKGKARPAAKPAAVKSETKAETTTATKAAAAFQRFKAARAEALGNAAPETGPAAGTETPAGAGTPPWPFPPSFSLPQMPQMPQMPQGWAGMLPQPGVVQPAPLAVGPLGDRLGSTLRLGIDVINMALAGSLRLLGGGGWGGHAQCHCGHGGYPSHHGYHGGGCDPCGGHDCCGVFEHEGCCNPSVGTCCD